MGKKAIKQSVSAVLIVRDEARTLAVCLDALRSAADEIVVVDTGSTDDTLAIARDKADRVMAFTWGDDFAAARNFALDQASNDYVLVVDADETLLEPEQARVSLQAFMAKYSANQAGLVRIANEMGRGIDRRFAYDRQARFFARDRYHYVGAIHEQLRRRDGRKTTAANLPVTLHHTGYARDAANADAKFERNRRILLQELEKQPKDSYYLYQLGKAWFSREEHEQAGACLKRAADAIDFVPPPPRDIHGPVSCYLLTDLLASLAYAYVNTEKLKEARTLLEAHAKLGHEATQTPDFHHARGYVLLMNGDIPKAEKAFRDALAEDRHPEQVEGAGSFSAHYHLGLLQEARHDVPAALDQYTAALRVRNDWPPLLRRLISIIVEYGAALPPEVWERCPRDLFTAFYLDRLKTLVAEGRMDDASLLLQAAATMAPELLEGCRKTLEEILDPPSE